MYRTNGIMKTAFKILEASPITKDLFSKPPRVVFRKNTNLKDMLVRPKLPSSENVNSNSKRKGCQSCNDKRCATCKIITTSNTFTSSITKRSYPIVGDINCKTNNVIYKLTCNNCPKDYVGLTTTPLHMRINNHRSCANRKDDKSVSQHALSHQQDFQNCFSLQGICKVPDQFNKLKLEHLEQAHQLVLKSKVPYGLNIR